MVIKFIKSGFKKVHSALSKTQHLLGHRIRGVLGKTIDEDTLEELEEVLYEADLGVDTVTDLVEDVRQKAKRDSSISGDKILEAIKTDLLQILDKNDDISLKEASPAVILVVGVNGSGKTTFIAKLANKYKKMGKKPLLCAADTFRAAAVDQLDKWADKLGVDIVKGQPGSDPSSVVFDAVSAAKSRGSDVAIIDTAGRLHGKTDLMRELEKMRKVCQKVIPEAPHETILVLDATTGQNAIDQALTFHKYTPITGLALTKLDGTAKGWVVIGIQRKLGVPIKFIGVGEGLDDLEPFDHQTFVSSMFD